MKTGSLGSFHGLHQLERHALARAEREQRADQRAVAGDRRAAERAREGARPGELAARRGAGRPGGSAEDVDHDLKARLPGGSRRALLGGDRRELFAHARVGAARTDRSRAAVDRRGERGRAAGVGLQRRPVDEQAHVAGVQRRQRAARGLEAGAARWARAVGAPQQVGVVLGQPEGRARARRGLRRGGRRGRRVVLRAAACAQQESRQQRERREQPGAPQTAETCSSSATRKEEPQPQAATTLGFETLKPAPCRLSS